MEMEYTIHIHIRYLGIRTGRMGMIMGMNKSCKHCRDLVSNTLPVEPRKV